MPFIGQPQHLLARGQNNRRQRLSWKSLDKIIIHLNHERTFFADILKPFDHFRSLLFRPMKRSVHFRVKTSLILI